MPRATVSQLDLCTLAGASSISPIDLEACDHRRKARHDQPPEPSGETGQAQVARWLREVLNTEAGIDQTGSTQSKWLDGEDA